MQGFLFLFSHGISCDCNLFFINIKYDIPPHKQQYFCINFSLGCFKITCYETILRFSYRDGPGSRELQAVIFAWKLKAEFIDMLE